MAALFRSIPRLNTADCGLPWHFLSTVFAPAYASASLFRLSGWIGRSAVSPEHLQSAFSSVVLIRAAGR